MNTYIYRGQKKLRCGYTTGSCAAAAAKAAAEMLLSGLPVQTVSLQTPAGIALTLDVTKIQMQPDCCTCAVRKDSGDDPDITNGILIFAAVSKAESCIEIRGGEGIGTVTKPGLDQPPGAAAINSTPRRMIAGAVTEIAEKYQYTGGFRIVISAPEGTALAKKTFNPRMGIQGGISIIGTTGIVEPMSSQALIDTIRTEANMRKAAGCETLVLTVGNYSEQFVRDEVPDLAARCVMCSNFIGDALDIGVSLGFSRILLIGHIGKLVKLGSGIMNTHSSNADGRMETLIACGALAGVDAAILRRLTECITVDAALDILYETDSAAKTLEILRGRIAYYLDARVRSELQTGAVLFSNQHHLLLKTENADAIIQTISEEPL